MLLTAVLASSLLLNDSAFWSELGARRALVCPPAQYSQCLTRIPAQYQQRFPQSSQVIRRQLGLRAAMAMPINDQQFAGMILWAPKRLTHSISALWNDTVYQLPLAQQAELTLWHELGHLEIAQLQQQGQLPRKLTPLEHEWLADSYMIWRSVRETGSLMLAQQQLDRRNMAVFADIENLSHWTALYLAPQFASFDVAQMQQSDFSDWLLPLFQRTTRYNSDELQEFSGLLQRLFGMGRAQSLPDYMSWRRPTLGQVVGATLERVMGKTAAETWMQQQNLRPDHTAAAQ